MAKWMLPEGRKPMTDGDLAALTRRLAGTAIDYKEKNERVAAALKRLRRKAEILKMDLRAANDMKYHDVSEMLALIDLMENNQ